MADGKDMQSSLDQEMGKIKSRGLTLDPDAQEMPAFPEPSFGSIEAEEQGMSAGSINESMLSDEEKLNRFGLKARKRADCYQPEKYSAELNSILEKV